MSTFADTSGGKLDGFTEEELTEMQAYIGYALFVMPLIARQARHKNPLNTYRDYVQVTDEDTRVERTAKEYLHDLIGRMPTRELIAKWYPNGRLEHIL